MYTILGSDQQQYGPVDAAGVIQWIQTGQANAATMVHKQGGSEWVPLSSMPEFAAALGGGGPASAGLGMPSVAPVAMAPQTKAPKVFGILHIVFGVICGGGAGFGIFANLRALALVPDDLKSYALVMSIISGLLIFMYILLLVGGIGLLKSRRWGRTLSLVYGVVAILLNIVNSLFQTVLKPDGTGSQGGSEAEAIGRGIGMMIVMVVLFIYPIIVLIFMSKANVKAALK
jgi:hypothetical protein